MIAALLKSVTTPPAPALLNAVTMLLLFTFCIPFEKSTTLLLIKVMAPVVFTFKSVKVLLVMFCERVIAELIM